MTYNITIEGSSETYECDENEPVVECLEMQGVMIECDCRVGVCGTCKVMLVSGKVNQQDQTVLEDGEIEQGFILSCVALPESDCVVKLIS